MLKRLAQLSVYFHRCFVNAKAICEAKTF